MKSSAAVEDHFDKVLRLFGDSRNELTAVEIEEYFEYADLSLTLELRGVDVIKRELIRELDECDDIDGDFFRKMATLVGMNVKHFTDDELDSIAAIYKKRIAKLSNPMTVHYVGGVLEKLNIEIDWTGSPFSRR